MLLLPLTFSWEVASCSRRRWGVAFHKSNLGENCLGQEGPGQGRQDPWGLHGLTTQTQSSVHALSQAVQCNQNRRIFLHNSCCQWRCHPHTCDCRYHHQAITSTAITTWPWHDFAQWLCNGQQWQWQWVTHANYPHTNQYCPLLSLSPPHSH